MEQVKVTEVKDAIVGLITDKLTDVEHLDIVETLEEWEIPLDEDGGKEEIEAAYNVWKALTEKLKDHLDTL